MTNIVNDGDTNDGKGYKNRMWLDKIVVVVVVVIKVVLVSLMQVLSPPWERFLF